MRSGGWKPFWAALFASLLVLVPLVGGTVLLSRQQLRTQLRQAARSESGVPIQLPKTTGQHKAGLFAGDAQQHSELVGGLGQLDGQDRKSTRLNSSHP